MSTRYVWSRHSVSIQTNNTGVMGYQFTAEYYGDGRETLQWYRSKSTTVDPEDGQAQLVDPEEVFLPGASIGSPRIYDMSGYHYYAVVTDVSTGLATRYPTAGLCYSGRIRATSRSEPSTSGGGVMVRSYEVTSYFAVNELVPGNLLNYISSATADTYPQNGLFGNFLPQGKWYKYQGSDSIDPSKVEYISSLGYLKGGEQMTLKVTPRNNTYGGTVSYQYEVQLNGGSSWITLQITEATSLSYTIPKGTRTFRARVQARDDMGFTSSTWVYGPQTTVVNNSVPTVPAGLILPQNIFGGEPFIVTWRSASDVDGNLAGYKLERSLDNGSWETVYTGRYTTHRDVVHKGALRVAYRVKAYDEDGDASDYSPIITRTVINNSPPTIICELSGDLGTKTAGFTVSYTVTDVDGGDVTVVERVGTLIKRRFTATLGQPNSFQITGDYFMRLLNGPQTVQIVAIDAGGRSASHELTFTKAVHSMSVTLINPLEVEESISVAILSVLGQIPEDANFQVMVTNNAKDAEPVWQDATRDIRAERNIVFANKVQANGPAFNFKLTASRGQSGQGGYVKVLKGAFQ